MKANIIRVWYQGYKYQVDWLGTDDETVTEYHYAVTLSEALAWCRINDIGWVRFVGFSDEWIELEEFRCLNKGAEK